jgi:hypothetical protein
MNHSKHYPTFIEHPKTGARLIVNTPRQHHRQLLTWGLDGLDPVPEPEATEVKAIAIDPNYPKWIENPATGERILVPTQQAEEQQLAQWNPPKEDELPEVQPPKSNGKKKKGNADAAEDGE